MTKHDRIYATLLVIAVFFWIVGAGSIYFAMKAASFRNAIVFIYACLVALTLLTLAMRLGRATHARLITLATNIILLPFFPVGTAIGIYGLMKVDKKPEDG